PIVNAENRAMIRQMDSDGDTVRCEQLSSEAQYEEKTWSSSSYSCVVSVGYRRCRDFDLSNQPGQDYAAAQSDSNYVVGVVADGVSQSFYGNLGAETLSEGLLEELWNCRHATFDQTSFEKL